MRSRAPPVPATMLLSRRFCSRPRGVPTDVRSNRIMSPPYDQAGVAMPGCHSLRSPVFTRSVLRVGSVSSQ